MYEIGGAFEGLRLNRVAVFYPKSQVPGIPSQIMRVSAIIRNSRLQSAFIVALAAFLAISCDVLWKLPGIKNLPKFGEPTFVPTPMRVVDRMLEIADVSTQDVIYDLGSGDGRIVIRAAKKYGAKGVGIEISPSLVELSRLKAKEAGVSELVEFRVHDALSADVSRATVVTLFLSLQFNAKLRPVLEKQLKPGTRVVSHEHPIKGWKPILIETLQPEPSPDSSGLDFEDDRGNRDRHTIYLWIMK